MQRLIILLLIVLLEANLCVRAEVGDEEIRFWIRNAIFDHGFSVQETTLATGLDEARVHAWITDATPLSSARGSDGDSLKLLPYPGGRHPRIGFLEGAINPERGTKASLFAPGEPHSYIVVDLPEAIFSNLGLLFLAHTHIPTVWEQQNIPLPTGDWTRNPDGGMELSRRLPNDISFGSKIIPTRTGVDMELWLFNGTPQALTGLRTQVCVMLKSLPGFQDQTSSNKQFEKPVAVALNRDSSRAVLTAWQNCNRVWGNEQVPCIHSDPTFPDCPPGETVRVKGRILFTETANLQSAKRSLAEQFQ